MADVSGIGMPVLGPGRGTSCRSRRGVYRGGNDDGSWTRATPGWSSAARPDRSSPAALWRLEVVRARRGQRRYVRTTKKIAIKDAESEDPQICNVLWPESNKMLF